MLTRPYEIFSGGTTFTPRLCETGAWPVGERQIPHQSTIVGPAAFQYIRHIGARILFRSPTAFALTAQSSTRVLTIRTGGTHRVVECGHGRYVLVKS
jgi:hypothetical protein